jgi:hypothetical protein
MAFSPGPVGDFVVRLLWEIAIRLDTNAAIANHGVYTNCWFLAFTDGAFTKVEEIGVLYHLADDETDCNNTPSSYFFNGTDKILYVHTAGGTAPSNYVPILAYFNLLISTHSPLVIDGRYHEPLLSISSIPEVTLATSLYHEGGTQQSFGTIKLNNGDGFFDTRLALYICQAKYMQVQAARLEKNASVESLVASDFTTIWEGWSGDIRWSETEIEVSTEDLRRALL